MPSEAIKPDGFREPDKAFVLAELDRLGRRVSAETKQYPPWRPWKRPPKSGPHKGGRRTGALGKSWRYQVQSGNRIVLIVESQGVRYARYVQGRNQTKVMRGRGWQTVRANFNKHYPEAQKRLAAWAQLRRV